MIMSDRLSEVSSVWLFVQSPRSGDPAHCDLTYPTSPLNVHLRNFDYRKPPIAFPEESCCKGGRSDLGKRLGVVRLPSEGK